MGALGPSQSDACRAANGYEGDGIVDYSAMIYLAVLLFKLSQDSLLKTEYGLSPLHSCELPLHNPSWEAFAKSCTDLIFN